MYTTLAGITLLIFSILLLSQIVFASERNLQKKTLVYRLSLFILYFLLFIFCGCSPQITARLANDFYLWQFERNFQQIPHLPSSELLASAAEVGLLVGNSNHCDFYVGQMRWTQEFSTEQIQNFYQHVTIPPARNEGTLVAEANHLVHVDLRLVENGLIYPKSADYYRLNTVSAWGIDMSEYKEGTLYIVSTFDVGYEPNHDMRCH